MKIPEMVPFVDEDARTINRLKRAGDYEFFSPSGPAFTFKIDGIPMACVGYECLENKIVAWMILSRDAKKHPRVFWSIRGMLDTVVSRHGTVYIGVRRDWERARRFAEWLGFSETTTTAIHGGLKYLVYVRKVWQLH